jgi:hypothetical protein
MANLSRRTLGACRANWAVSLSAEVKSLAVSQIGEYAKNSAAGNWSNFDGTIVAYLLPKLNSPRRKIMNKGRDREAQHQHEISTGGLNVLLAAQPSVVEPHGQMKGEYLLTDAVLREAIREYQKFARYQSRRGVKLFHDVDQWFSVDDRDSCFSFINVCQILDLEPTYIRTGLQMWRERIAN